MCGPTSRGNCWENDFRCHQCMEEIDSDTTLAMKYHSPHPASERMTHRGIKIHEAQTHTKLQRLQNKDLNPVMLFAISLAHSLTRWLFRSLSLHPLWCTCSCAFWKPGHTCDGKPVAFISLHDLPRLICDGSCSKSRRHAAHAIPSHARASSQRLQRFVLGPITTNKTLKKADSGDTWAGLSWPLTTSSNNSFYSIEGTF